MPNIFIDPYLFACPKVNDGKDTFVAYVRDLLEWESLCDCKWARVFILRETYSILAKQNHYPLWSDLKTMIEKYSIDYIQPDNIVILVNSFLDKFTQIESTLQIIDLLAEHTIIKPSNHLNERAEPFQEIYKKTLIYMSLKSRLHQEPSDEQLLITTEIDSNSRVSIEAELIMIEFEDGSENEAKLSFPVLLSDVFTNCKNYENLLLSVNPETMWLKSNNSTSSKMAIIICTYILSRNINTEIKFNELLDVEFGKSFINSAQGLGFCNEQNKIKMFLRSVSELILSVNLNKSHALRNDEGGNNLQIEQNGYKAWRRDIDYEYHLHYWKKAEHIILSSIVTHNDFNIMPFC